MDNALDQRTRFCARIIGPLMLIMGAIVIARWSDIMAMMPALLQDTPLMFVTGIFILIAGLILFAAHHHWSSPAAIAVSLIALLTILRGVLLMTAPSVLAGLADYFMQAAAGAIVAGGVALVLGLWLSYEGWVARPRAG